VKITLDSGAEYEGTYSTGSESTHTLKMVTQKKQGASTETSNGSTKLNRDQATMSFSKKDVADVHVTGAALPSRDSRLPNGRILFSIYSTTFILIQSIGNTSTFRTDTAISGNKFQGERTLQRWVPDENIAADMSLGGNKGADGAGWDQFATNERLFGLKTDYDENIYTTAIDKSHPDYKKRYADADRKAREIEKSSAFNSHVAEERIADNTTMDESGLDEEDK
jgi:PAB1-binding protein PBP1